MMATPDSTDEQTTAQASLPPRFASVVAHELRNPLSAVKIALQTVGHGETLAAKDATRLRIALREVGTIERVLELVLEWARPSQLTPVDTTLDAVVELVEASIHEALDQCGTALEVEVEAARVSVDAPRVAFAVSELVRNAAFASPQGDPVHLRCATEQGGLVFEIRDSGPGLGEEALARAFEPFWSGRARGVGLGLAVARDVARRHGGDLTIENATPRGCVARLTLPPALER